MARKVWRKTKTLLALRNELVRIERSGESITGNETVQEARIATMAGTKMRVPGLIRRIDAVLALRGENPAVKRNVRTVEVPSKALQARPATSIDNDLLSRLGKIARKPGDFIALGAHECTEILRALRVK